MPKHKKKDPKSGETQTSSTLYFQSAGGLNCTYGGLVIAIHNSNTWSSEQCHHIMRLWNIPKNQKLNYKWNLDQIQYCCEDVVLLWIETQPCAISLCLSGWMPIANSTFASKVFFFLSWKAKKYYHFIYANKMSQEREEWNLVMMRGLSMTLHPWSPMSPR